MNKEIVNFIYWYMKELYPCHKAKQHAFIKPQQFKRCHDVLKGFADEFKIDIAELPEVAESFFKRVQGSDHNINAFCVDEMLKTRYADTYAVFPLSGDIGDFEGI